MQSGFHVAAEHTERETKDQEMEVGKTQIFCAAKRIFYFTYSPPPPPPVHFSPMS